VTLKTILLILHIAGGSVALVAIPVALGAAKTRGAHTFAGMAFVVGMGLAMLSAFPLAWLVGSPFLAGVGIFSSFLVVSGWRWLRRPGFGTSVAWGRGLAWGMLLAAMPLVGVGVSQFVAGDPLGIVLVVFAAIGGALAVEDLLALRTARVGKSRRTVLNLGRMLGAAIATVTAVLVVNVSLEPAWLVWLAPTLVGTPAIAVWSVRAAK
jgi:hypothetical protein